MLSPCIQSRASRNLFIGLHGEDVPAHPPVDNKANIYLQKWLAKAFKVPKKYIVLLRGNTNRHKQFIIKEPLFLPP